MNRNDHHPIDSAVEGVSDEILKFIDSYLTYTNVMILGETVNFVLSPHDRCMMIMATITQRLLGL